MENMGNTTVGVDARLYERLAIRLSLSRPSRRLGIWALDRLCDRCSKSGRCISDLFGDACRHTTADELGCPCWCRTISCLKSMDEPEADNAATSDLDEIPF